MTDPTRPPDDEIVSAVLDGEATADERARVEADPALAARLERFGEIRRQLAAPVPVPADARERAMAAALAELDASRAGWRPPDSSGPGGGGSGAPVASVTVDPRPAPDELAARRARRGRAAPILAAAAAVVLVLVGLGAVLTASRGANETATTSAAPERANAPTSTTAGGAAADSSGPDAGDQNLDDQVVTTTSVPTSSPAVGSPAPASNQETAFAAAPPVAIGAVSSPGELRAAIFRTIDQGPAPSTTVPGPTTVVPVDPQASAGVGAFTTCGSYLLAVDPEVGTVLATATATYGGRPAMVYAFAIDRTRFPAANGTVRIYALDPGDCSTLSVQTTDP